MYTKILQLRTWNYGANVSKSADQESNGLKEEVNKVVVLPMDKIIASTDEEERSKSQLQQMKSAECQTNNIY